MKERLKALRGALGLSQTELAKKIGSGLAAVQSWEAGSLPKAEYGASSLICTALRWIIFT